MFEKLLRELKDLEGTQRISIPINSDKDGYLDKECPNEECLFQFKVDEEDWKNLFQDEKVYCPLCRHEANSNSWWTKEQLDKAKNEVRSHIRSRFDKAFIEGARDFNSKQLRNSFVSMSISVTGTKPYHFILPIPSMEEMQLKIQCKECNSKYAVIGSAFFCPCCGHNSANETFDNSIKKIESKIKNISIIRIAIEEISKDEAETTCRSLIETSLGECVVAFQRFCEVTFLTKSPNTKLKFNAFQNLEVGGQYWKDLFNESYFDWLTKQEYLDLNELFQKRHLLSHTEGIVDQKYIEKSGDNIYKVGQRIVIKENDVKRLTKLITKLVETLRQK